MAHSGTPRSGVWTPAARGDDPIDFARRSRLVRSARRAARLEGLASNWGHTINFPFAVLVGVYAGSFAYLYLRCRDHLPLQKYLSNHAFFLAPLNFLFTFFVTGRQSAIFETKSVPG